MTTDQRDCPPGTVPPWVLRFAYDGEEWLVLIDQSRTGTGNWHDGCYKRPPADHPLYNIDTGDGFGPCNGGCGGLTIKGGEVKARCHSLAEAHAAFDRIEEEWRAAKAVPA
ncbi:MAG: hypothetical protein NUW01_02300 [Gemmatimonadaceae bacterium]|nr:hypothetical protein [Gemmatimonadaceae bacterium]